MFNFSPLDAAKIFAMKGDKQMDALMKLGIKALPFFLPMLTKALDNWANSVVLQEGESRAAIMPFVKDNNLFVGRVVFNSTETEIVRFVDIYNLSLLLHPDIIDKMQTEGIVKLPEVLELLKN